MKKLFCLILMATLFMMAVPHNAAAQNNYVVMNHQLNSTGWYFSVDTIAGKAPVLVLLKDSAGTWFDAKITNDSVSSRSFSLQADEAWWNTVLNYQDANPFGILDKQYYYRLSSTGTGKVYYPGHYKYMLIYYRP